MIQCRRCLGEFPDDGFYRDRGRRDCFCKQCRKDLARAWREANPDRCYENRKKWRAANPGREAPGQRARDRIEYWDNPEAARSRVTDYCSRSTMTDEQREKYNEKRREKYRSDPSKVRARLKVSYALRKGYIVRPDSCPCCGVSGVLIEAHHADYSRPLDVTWLCSKCHGEKHRIDSAGVAS